MLSIIMFIMVILSFIGFFILLLIIYLAHLQQVKYVKENNKNYDAILESVLMKIDDNHMKQKENHIDGINANKLETKVENENRQKILEKISNTNTKTNKLETKVENEFRKINNKREQLGSDVSAKISKLETDFGNLDNKREQLGSDVSAKISKLETDFGNIQGQFDKLASSSNDLPKDLPPADLPPNDLPDDLPKDLPKDLPDDLPKDLPPDDLPDNWLEVWNGNVSDRSTVVRNMVSRVATKHDFEHFDDEDGLNGMYIDATKDYYKKDYHLTTSTDWDTRYLEDWLTLISGSNDFNTNYDGVIYITHNLFQLHVIPIKLSHTNLRHFPTLLNKSQSNQNEFVKMPTLILEDTPIGETTSRSYMDVFDYKCNRSEAEKKYVDFNARDINDCELENAKSICMEDNTCSGIQYGVQLNNISRRYGSYFLHNTNLENEFTVKGILIKKNNNSLKD